jgi:hypothetical protein
MRFTSGPFEVNGDICGAPLIKKACPMRSECFGYGDVLDILVQKRKDIKGCRALFQEIDERAGSLCQRDRHGQTPQLRCGEKSNHVHLNALL